MTKKEKINTSVERNDEQFDKSPSTRMETCWKCKGNGYKFNKSSKKYDGKKCGVCKGSGNRFASSKAQRLAKQPGIVTQLRGSPIDGSFVGPPAHGSLIREMNDEKGQPLSKLVKRGEIMAALGCGNWRIYQLAAGHKLTVDDYICAWVACEEMTKRGFGNNATFFTHADIGCGCGSVLMTVAWYFQGSVVSRGVEAQSVSFDLLQRSLLWNVGVNGSKHNNGDGTLSKIEVANVDLRGWDGGKIGNSSGYDLITGTPPYFPQKQFISSQNHNQKVRCRVPTRGAACDYVEAASRLLSDRGIFVMVETSRKEAENAVLDAVKQFNLSVIRRLDVIPRKGLPSRFSCWVIEKKRTGVINDVKFDANSSKQSTARTFPVSNFLLRLGEEDHHRRSEEYVNSMKKMGWINFEEFKITKDMEVNLTNNTTATERTRRRMGLMMGTFIFGSFLFHIVRKSI